MRGGQLGPGRRGVEAEDAQAADAVVGVVALGGDVDRGRSELRLRDALGVGPAQTGRVVQRLARRPAVGGGADPGGAVVDQAVEQRRAVLHRPEHGRVGGGRGLVEEAGEVAREHVQLVDGDDGVGGRPRHRRNAGAAHAGRAPAAAGGATARRPRCRPPCPSSLPRRPRPSCPPRRRAARAPHAAAAVVGRALGGAGLAERAGPVRATPVGDRRVRRPAVRIDDDVSAASEMIAESAPPRPKLNWPTPATTSLRT